MSGRICAAKGCNTSVPAYSRYCIKHEDECLTPDVIIITTQPTSDSESTNCTACCGCCTNCECFTCCEDGCCDSADECCED